MNSKGLEIITVATFYSEAKDFQKESLSNSEVSGVF